MATLTEISGETGCRGTLLPLLRLEHFLTTMVGGKDFSCEAFSFQRGVLALGGKVFSVDYPLGGGVAEHKVRHKAGLQVATWLRTTVQGEDAGGIGGHKAGKLAGRDGASVGGTVYSLNQNRIAHSVGCLQAGKARGSVGLVLGGVRGVVRGYAVGSTVQQGMNHGLSVLFAAEGRVHDVPQAGVIFCNAKSQMMGRYLAGDSPAPVLCGTDGIHGSCCAHVGKVELAASLMCKVNVPLRGDVLCQR